MTIRKVTIAVCAVLVLGVLSRTPAGKKLASKLKLTTGSTYGR
jgi:hypothetical protein